MPPDPPSKCVLHTHIIHINNVANGLSTFYLLPTGLLLWLLFVVDVFLKPQSLGSPWGTTRASLSTVCLACSGPPDLIVMLLCCLALFIVSPLFNHAHVGGSEEEREKAGGRGKTHCHLLCSDRVQTWGRRP